jgi:serine/threonine protein kinase
MNNDVAAPSLVGLTLKDVWKVKNKIEKTGSQTGSHFSVGYIVEKDGKDFFLKAFNVNSFLNNSGDFMKTMTEMTDAYNYEKELSEHCMNKHVDKVSFVIDFGEIMLEKFPFPVVPFLVFELANGDIRKAIDFSNKINTIWKFHSLHEIAIGLKQLHTINVSHQDLKPSNILVFNKNNDSKICDLGRSACLDIKSNFLNMQFTGDLTYAPPETWYKIIEPDWKKRTFAIDCYMLGSLITFYFAGVSMTSILLTKIKQEHHHLKWTGTFKEIESYLQIAFSEALIELKKSIDSEFCKDDIIELITQLCNPNPDKRGYCKKITTHNKYSLERIISKLNLLKYNSQIHFKAYNG